MIEIDISPNLFTSGSFILSWHGFFSFIAVASAVYLVGRWAPLKRVEPDAIYSIAIWAIIGGVIGARIVHVVDNWGYYGSNPSQIIAIWTGGIGIWGGILGGTIGGITGALVMKQPVGIIADLTAPALVLAQTIGRVGDIVNGEHCAKAWDFALGWIWVNPASDARICVNNNGVGDSVHPVIGYEMLWNMISLAILWKLRNRIKPDGMLFAIYLALYSIGRFAITFGRDDRIWAIGLQEAQFISLVVLAIVIPLLIIKARPAAVIPATPGMEEVPEEPRPRGTRAQRRRRMLGR
jgi:phosphatidylglycerol:prolipoprotein diacylglycerol transferase